MSSSHSITSWMQGGPLTHCWTSHGLATLSAGYLATSIKNIFKLSPFSPLTPFLGICLQRKIRCRQKFIYRDFHFRVIYKSPNYQPHKCTKCTRESLINCGYSWDGYPVIVKKSRFGRLFAGCENDAFHGPSTPWDAYVTRISFFWFYCNPSGGCQARDLSPLDEL